MHFQVCLNGFGDITAKNNPLLQATANGRNRDYEKEAVQFFEAKLQKFGPELQIKSLLGHRSQAAPEVRLNEDQPIPMDIFYQKFCDRFSHTVRQEVATNPKELLQFLKLNRNVFFIRSNKNTNNNGILTQSALNRINLVKALKPAQEAISSLNGEIDAMDEKVIGVDFKTVTLGIQGEEFLSLVVVATQSQIVVFDLVHSDTILLESGLKEILESEKIIKVAHAVLQHEKFGKALSEMRSISFLNLQRVYYPQSIMMSDATPRKLSQSPR
uniref:3'-5' exonuclease domain-containing protein n=1 Tax=Parascaris equorum TaxID=6256 RepID=A0A914RZ88_PAREQ